MIAVALLLFVSKPLSGLVGAPADVAPSAYAFRADRRLSDNPPESFFALMRAAGVPLNHRLDPRAPAITATLCSLLWEENRPIETFELSWPASAQHIPKAEDLKVEALVPTSSANSWFNNVEARPLQPPGIFDSGRTYRYAVGRNTCGLVVRVAHGSAAGFDVPDSKAFEIYGWKPMSLEIEWGFQRGTTGKDYSGRIEAYDGRIADLSPLGGATRVRGRGWTSPAASGRRGVKLNLLYIGQTSWPKVRLWTTQPQDVARSIITVWTRSGSFSFNPADLEHGHIFAPEYGFFVRRTSPVAPDRPPRHLQRLFVDRMDEVVGSPELKGWGTAATPLVSANPTAHDVTSLGVSLPARTVAVHPGQYDAVMVSWRCPKDGVYSPRLLLSHRQSGGIGVRAELRLDTPTASQSLAVAVTDGKPDKPVTLVAGPIGIRAGDRLVLSISNIGDYRSCTVGVDFDVADQGGAHWSLAEDVAGNLLEANPHPARSGAPEMWAFGQEGLLPDESHGDVGRPDLSENVPPIGQALSAKTGSECVKELTRDGLRTIRERTRAHPEMTWDAAIRATRGDDLPPIPPPPPGAEPKMRIDVPDERFEAQWNLGAWHLTRHCATNPQTGRLWFNDYPYGILAAETYLVLSVLDQMGEHVAARAGFDQWTMLPIKRDHPVGLFTDGNGAFTFATGPDGFGGNMDGIHAFGPGAIGWALAQHYWLTGDAAWLKANAARLKANAMWMLRQREVNRADLPGGSKLWCAGLEPALQVTPDSGGLWMNFYEAEGYYCSSIGVLADALSMIGDPDATRLARAAARYRKDLRSAVDRSITLSPVVPVRDGTYHSVLPFACYCRGAATGAWGWRRDGSGNHVGPLYWDTVQNGASLIWPAGILSPQDVRVQGYLDVLEDRFLLENPYVGDRNWFFKGWQYQAGLERTANLHLVADDPRCFLRTLLNDYAVDVLPKNGYVFNEHAVHGPPDKVFEEAAFLERLRDMLVMEDGANLWLARAVPEGWLSRGRHVAVSNAPTAFGDVTYRLDTLPAGAVRATIDVPTRRPAREILLRLRVHGEIMKSVIVNGRPCRSFNSNSSTVRLSRPKGRLIVVAAYRPS